MSYLWQASRRLASGFRRWRWFLLASVAAIAMSGIYLLAHAQAEPVLADPNTEFHRIYVLGNGNDAAEDSSFENDLSEFRNDLESGQNQANGSTSRTLRSPTQQELQDTLNEVFGVAQSGDEVTFYFQGHGGYRTFADANGDEADGFDEHIVLNADDWISDDDLAQMLAGRPAEVTLVLFMDSCYGGGFTGGATDVQETDHVAVIGPSNTCPIDPWGIFGGLVETLSEDGADGAGGREADSDGNGIVTAQELKNFLTGNGWRLGPPQPGQQPSSGKSKCSDCSLPSITLDPPIPHGQELTPVTVAGNRFTPGTVVTLESCQSASSCLNLGDVQVGLSGQFTRTVQLPGQALFISAADQAGTNDWYLWGLTYLYLPFLPQDGAGTFQQWSFETAPSSYENMPADKGWKNPGTSPDKPPSGKAPGSGYIAQFFGQSGSLVLQNWGVLELTIPNPEEASLRKEVVLAVVYRFIDGTAMAPGEHPTVVGNDGIALVKGKISDAPFGDQGWRLFSATYTRANRCPGTEVVKIGGSRESMLITQVTVTTSCKKLE